MSKRKREAGAAGGNDGGGRLIKRARTNGESELETMNGLLVREPQIVPGLNQSSSKELEPAKREAKRQRRQAKKDQTGFMGVRKSDDLAKHVASDEQLVNPSSKEKEKGSHKTTQTLDWNVSEALGGRMLDLDPVFSIDEQHLLLAYESSIRVYSAATSTMVRSLPIRRDNSITGFVISPSNPSRLYLSTGTGLLEEWDWTEGERRGRWDISSQIHGLGATGPVSSGQKQDIVYTIDKKKIWMITAHRLRMGNESDKTELQTLLKSQEPLTSSKVLDRGKIIVVSGGQRLIVGKTENAGETALKEVSYVWREIECSEWITSMDAQIDKDIAPVGDLKGSKQSAPKSRSDVVVNIAVGCAKGPIFVYEDLLGKFIRKERAKKSVPPTAQRLHWHRNGIGSLKWSADGNYVISGGLETVLVLWQLDTGQKQTLPHLSAAIESVVVSPSGSSYAVRLSDNSAMVLSTTELQPTVSVSGIQVPITRHRTAATSLVPQIDGSYQDSSLIPLRLPAIVSPSSPGHLLLAVPASSASKNKASPSFKAAYLQTYDVRSSSQVRKQALTRTKITHLNMGPESNILEEPNVTLLQVSQDGRWLATVDEWMPPDRDVAAMATNDENTVKEQRSRLETYLKFWLFNDESHAWELVSRMDNPHSTGSGASKATGKILDLVSNPSTTGFVTFGNDGIVRFWQPNTRHRDGIEVRGQDGRNLTTWVCRQVTPIHDSELLSLEDEPKMTAKLAFSTDGSALAVGHQFLSQPLVHVVESETGEICHDFPDLFCGTLIGLGIIDRYMIVLSDELIVWDLVDDTCHYGFNLHSFGFSTSKRTAATHLSIDQKNKTFAVALPELVQPTKMITKLRTQIAVFDPASPTPLYTTTLPRTMTSLLPATHRKGYYTIDTAAEVRTVTPLSKIHKQLVERVQEEIPSTSGLENIYGKTSSMLVTQGERQQDFALPAGSRSGIEPIMDEYDGDVLVVRQHQLAEIFDTAPSFALPPITDLFEHVARLFSKKSKT